MLGLYFHRRDHSLEIWIGTFRPVHSETVYSFLKRLQRELIPVHLDTMLKTPLALDHEQ